MDAPDDAVRDAPPGFGLDEWFVNSVGFGFGPAVVDELLDADGNHPLPANVRVVDYGIRGIHLSYDLLSGVDALVLIDAVPSGSGGSPLGCAVICPGGSGPGGSFLTGGSLG